ncbi:MAG TPA: DUF5668 domain-containing protein [Candidatus Limnocylindria bacterium]
MKARRGLFWPLLLIVIGLVFLLANFGLIAPISVLALASLWPLILILVGLDIAIGRRWPLATLAADVLVIGAGLVLVATQSSLPGIFTFGDGVAGGTTTASVQRSDAKTLTLRLAAGASRYTVHGADLGTAAVSAQSDRDDLVVRDQSRTGDRLSVRLDQGVNIRFGFAHSTMVDTTVASDLPTSLQIDAGAGDFILDLSNVKLTDARVSVGAAQLRIVAPTPSGDVPITVSAGASSVIIEIPAGVEARVTNSGGLTSTRYDGSRFSGGETAGYASAKDRVTIRVTSGAGSVVVR